MGELLTTVVSGGVTGILGTALSGVFGYFNKRRADKHELAMREMDMRELRLEAESAEKRMALKIEGDVKVAEAETMAESIRSEAAVTEKWGGIEPTPAQTWVLLFIDFVRAMMRPGITIFALWFSFGMYVDSGRPDEHATRVVEAVLFVMISSSLWWFGTRGMNMGGPGTGQMTKGNGRRS